MKTFLKPSLLIALIVVSGRIYSAAADDFFQNVPAPTQPADANQSVTPSQPAAPAQPAAAAQPAAPSQLIEESHVVILSEPAVPEKLADGIIVPFGDSLLKVELFGDNVVRVAFARDRAFFTRQSVITEPKRAIKTDWSLNVENGFAMLATPVLQVYVNLTNAVVSFFDAKGRPVLAEKTDGRTITRAEVQGEQTFHVRQQWEPKANESLYGLGQRQIGILDIKGWDLDLWQHNTHVVVPFLVSSRGYGVLWDNLSFTRFGDLRPF